MNVGLRTLLPHSVEQSAPLDIAERTPDGEVNEERLALDVGGRQKAPEATVFGVVAVVAHHEVVPLRHHPLAAGFAAHAAHFLADLVLHRAEFFLVQLGAAQGIRLGAQQLLGDRLGAVDRALLRAAAVEVNKLEKRVPFLATIASVAPFIGLFGTVWGILITFQRIGVTGSTNLATVGPGIADALIAIKEEALNNPEVLHSAPHTTPVNRLDEVKAARNPVLCYKG